MGDVCPINSLIIETLNGTQNKHISYNKIKLGPNQELYFCAKYSEPTVTGPVTKIRLIPVES